MKSQKISSIFFAAIALTIIFLNALLYESQKEGFFLDEKATFHIANASYTNIGDFWSRLRENHYIIPNTVWQTLANAPMIIGERYSLDEVESMLDAQRGDKFTVMSTYLLSRPDSHPPFYYLLFNFLNSCLKGVSLTYVGFIINISALLLTCIFIYLIILKFCDDWLCSILGMLFYGLSFDFINNVMYIRMYALLTLWLIALLYLYLGIVQDDYEIKKYRLRAICTVEFFAMLTQFYAVLFIFPLFCITVLCFVIFKKKIKQFIVGHIITALVYLIIWPFSIFQVTTNGRSADIANNVLAMNIVYRLKEFVNLLKLSIFSGSKVYLFLSVAIVLFFGFVKIISFVKNSSSIIWTTKEFWLGVYLCVPAFSFYLVSAIISPWIIDRYVMPVIPIICTIIVLAFWKSVKVVLKNNWLCAAIITIVIIWSYVNALKYTPKYAFQMTKEKETFISDNQSKEALIIDPYNDTEFLDVVADVKHPYWTLVKDNVLKEYLNEKFDADRDWVIYVNKFCDRDEIKNIFEASDYSLVKCEYTTDFFDVYYFGSH